MKRIIVAITLFVTVLSFYLCGHFYIIDTCKETKTLLHECVVSYDNGDNPLNCAEKLKKFWGNKEKVLSVFVNHRTIDDIEMAIDSLLSYSDSNNDEIFHEYADTVKTLIHQLKEDMLPSAHSVL